MQVIIDFVNKINNFSLKMWFFNSLKSLCLEILGASYYVCLFTAIISIFIYIIGYKKAGKVCAGSTIAYFIMEAFRQVYL